ncbi:uracil phosphoribosyltransferase [Spiroplasma endosymbiont of Aspidapion aeneum]|uniref:uracil phosphoribosyltransferase n=1 Tax=Spiroplasma endosymbiont of Aspidapion aeneum TaxID=3066276 RepID=UPI00313CBD77
MGLIILDHPLITDKLTRMRKVETNSKDFRENLNEISQLMVYEIFRDVETIDIKIKTPVGKTVGKKIKKPVVLVPIIRAGLGMIHGIVSLLPSCKIAHIGLYRNEETLQPVKYYAKAPDDIARCTVVVVDPMLATGGSASAAIDIVKEWGVKDIKFVCLVAVPEGVKLLANNHPEIDVYVGALDEKLNEKGYIVPGLGDAGDRIYGTK